MANSGELFGPVISYCKDPLWIDFNSSITNNNLPFTWCFQHAVLGFVPIIFYLITLPILFIQAKLSVRPPLPEDYLTSMKSGLTVLLISDKTFLLIRLLWERYGIGQVVPLVEYILPAAQILTFLSILGTSKRSLNNGINSSGPIFCTWLLIVLCGFPEFYTWLILGLNPATLFLVNSYEYIAYLVFYPLVCLQLILHFFTVRHLDQYKNLSPESQSSFFSRQFYCWFNGIVRKGRASPLETDDLFELEPEMSGAFLYNEWKRVWLGVTEEYHKKRESRKFFETYQELHHINDKTPLVHTTTKLMHYGSHNQCVKPDETPEPEYPSIIKQLFLLFKWQFIGSNLCKVITDILQYVNPLLLSVLITFIEDKEAPMWKGVSIAVLMFVVAELRSLLLNQYFTLMYRVGIKIQSILTLAVFEKALKLSTSSRQERALGEMINLMAIDVDRFQNITPQLQQYWSSPFSISIALFILYKTVGLSALGGVLILILLIPANAIVMIVNKRWQTSQMKIKDERLKLTNEALNGIRVVKLYAWEQAMIRKINDLRKQEVYLMRKAQLTRSVLDVCNAGSPFIITAITFALFTLTSENNLLTPQIAFVTLAVFSQLRAPLFMSGPKRVVRKSISLFMIAELIGQTVQVVVSNKRLKSFLVAEQYDENAVLRDSSSSYVNAVNIEDATFAWDKEADQPTLRTLQLEIPKGQLICVVGEVGTGKSSLLSALLNEMEKIHGFVGVHGSIAYVPQQSWIQSMSIRENILFNKVYDAALYQEVIGACALEKDFEFLPDGDLTMIGEKGVNLSGGQKSRISLARALYQKSEILLLDDPLSAVDAVVGRTIFDKALGPNGLSKNATRLMVTHSQIPLEYANQIIVMRNGEFFRVGSYAELLRDDEANQLIRKLEDENSPIASTSGSSNTQEDEVSSTTDEDAPPRSLTRSIKDRKKSRASSRLTKSEKEKLEKKPFKLIEDERVETGRVNNKVYLYYFRKMGLPVFFGFTIFLILNFASSGIRGFWLSAWSDNVEHDSIGVGVRLSVFIGLGTCEMLFLYTSNVFLIFATVNSSLRLHAPLLYNMMCAPIQFFDTTPLGRVINRFSKDIEVVDLRLSSTFRFLFICTLSSITTLVIISVSTPAFILIIIPLFVIYILIIRFYIPTARQLQRLASVTRSPILSMFSETIQGVSSIRAYNVAGQFYNDFCGKLDLHLNCKYYALASSRWLSMRLEILGNIVILSAALLGVLAKEYGFITAGIIGLSVSYSLNMTNMLNFLIKSLADVETNIVSVERISEFSNVQEEADWEKGRHGVKLALPRNWPQNGSILFKNLSVRYRPELEYALIDVNAEIASGEKVGIVGRTGAGKSSLALTLFRMIEPTNGQIFIDGINTAQLGLHTIRGKLTVIPQDPVLFSGTLRFNLDPFYKHTDSELWQALSESNLKAFVQTLPHALNHVISEGGSNISMGQRQLICLARAILRRSKIVVIDEGTSSVDQETDRIIQQTIREKFAESTILTIAHRINTVMDYNRIMVFQHGRLVEFDTPANLLRDSNSVFYSLVNSK